MKDLQELQNALRKHEKITILGHDNIDVDAFLSGILLSNLLNFLGIENEFLILEEIQENDTYHMMKDIFHIDMKNYYTKEEKQNRNLFLEDHFETMHKGNVIACLDHHITENTVVGQYPFYYSRIASSTSYMIYELMKEAGYKISKKEAKMLVFSMMIDTVSFRSKKTVTTEKLEAKKICEQYGLDYKQMEKDCLCLTPIDKLSVEQIISNGYKDYNYYGKRVKSSYIQVYGDVIASSDMTKWIDNIMTKINEKHLEMWVFIVFDCKNRKTYQYRITKRGFKMIQSNGILSRGTNIMPQIEKLFKEIFYDLHKQNKKSYTNSF